MRSHIHRSRHRRVAQQLFHKGCVALLAGHMQRPLPQKVGRRWVGAPL